MAVNSWVRRVLNGQKWRFPAGAVAQIGGENERSTRNRGPFRHYIDLPMVRPFVGITGCRLAVAILRELLGARAAVRGRPRSRVHAMRVRAHASNIDTRQYDMI